MTDYTLVRSKRKTVAIYIRDGGVEVRAPLKTPKRDIDRFVASKEKWIANKLVISSERLESREMFELTYGDAILLQGKEYRIIARNGNRAGSDGEVFYMPPNLLPEQIKAVCVKTYRNIA